MPKLIGIQVIPSGPERKDKQKHDQHDQTDEKDPHPEILHFSSVQHVGKLCGRDEHEILSRSFEQVDSVSESRNEQQKCKIRRNDPVLLAIGVKRSVHQIIKDGI